MIRSIILMFTVFLTILLLSVTHTKEASQERYPYKRKGKWGYLDEQNLFAIAPQFEQASRFSNNLAAVRVQGYYGYIGPDGSWKITPQFDYAEPFTGLLAVVYKNGMAMVIDTTGRTILPPEYKSIIPLDKGNRFIVTDTIGCEGLVDADNHVIVPLGEYSIWYNHPGIIVEYQKLGSYNRDSMALLNEEGKPVITVQNPTRLEVYGDGYFQISNRPGGKSDLVIDATGKPVKKGFVLFDPSFRVVHRFGDQAFIVMSGYNEYEVLDKQGNRLFEYTIDEIATRLDNRRQPDLRGGLAYVNTSKGWFLIDSTGSILNGPFSVYDGVARVGNGLIYRGWYEDERLYGIWNGLTGKKRSPDFEDMFGFWPNGLPKLIMRGDKIFYLDSLGNTLWQRNEQELKTQTLNIDYMNRGYFYASSFVESESLGGWGKSYNVLQKIESKHHAIHDSLSLVLNTKERVKWYNNIAGYALHMFNTTTDTICFSAQDSRLPMVVQALDAQGKWHDIEYLPTSWCGNSYHTLAFPPGYFWEFAVPEYEGAVKTRLRVKVSYGLCETPYKFVHQYSNEWKGSINPAQLWRRPDYYPGGIMDPYYN